MNRAPDEPAAGASRPRAREAGPSVLALFVGALACIAIGIAIVLTVVAVTGDEVSSPVTTATTHEFTVPLGTGRLLDQGRPVDFFPARLEVRVGDTLVVHNEDNRMHTVGPYLVDRGETLTQTFTTPGTLRGLCTIHPSGAVEIVVRAA